MGSIAKTLSARESLMIDTHPLQTSSDKLDTLPPNPTSFEPLLNSLIPQKFTRAYLVLLFLKKRGAKAAAIKTAL